MSERRRVYEMLNSAIKTNERNIARLSDKTEVSGQTWTFPTSTLANAPLAADGLTAYAVRFISDGRKSGETAGNGTGVPAYYNPATNTWLAFRTDTVVTT